MQFVKDEKVKNDRINDYVNHQFYPFVLWPVYFVKI